MDYILKFGTNFQLTCEKTYKLGKPNGTNVVSKLSQKLQYLIAKSRPNIGFGDTKRKSLIKVYWFSGKITFQKQPLKLIL